MVSSKKPPSEPSAPLGGRRRRRPVPTIDLTATEVETAPSTTQAGSTGEPAQSASVQSESEQSPPTEPRSHVPRDPPPPAPEQPWDRVWRWLRANMSWPYAAAGLAGGLLVCMVLFAMWLTGLVPIRYAGTTAMRARVSVLEMQVHDLQNRSPAPAGADGKAFDDLLQRLGKLETALTQAKPGAVDPALLVRLDAVENALKALGVTLTALNRRADEAIASAADAGKRADAAAKAANDVQSAPAATPSVDRSDVDALNKRIADLERATKAVDAAAAKPAIATDPAVRLALAVGALRTAALRGEPFALLLDTVKALGAEPQQLAALEPFARSGIPTDAQLSNELSALVPALLKSSGANAAHDGTFLERLQANASHLVRVRPVDAPQGDDAGAIVARIEVATARGDVGAARAELNKLSPAARAPAEAWMKKVDARQAALDSSNKLSADVFRSLSNRTP